MIAFGCIFYLFVVLWFQIKVKVKNIVSNNDDDGDDESDTVSADVDGDLVASFSRLKVSPSSSSSAPLSFGRMLVTEDDPVPLQQQLEIVLQLMKRTDPGDLREISFKAIILGLLTPEIVSGQLTVESEFAVNKQGSIKPGYCDLKLSVPGHPTTYIELKYHGVEYLQDGKYKKGLSKCILNGERMARLKSLSEAELCELVFRVQTARNQFEKITINDSITRAQNQINDYSPTRKDINRFIFIGVGPRVIVRNV